MIGGLRQRAVEAVRGACSPTTLAALASVALSVRARSRCVVRHDDGCWVHRYAEGTVVNRTLGGLSAAQEDAVARDIWLHHYLPTEGDVVVDVGAGVGSEIRLLSRLAGTAGRVIAIEAHPATFRCLQRTVALNQLANVTLAECAVVATAGPVRLVEDAQSHLRNGLSRDPSSGVEVEGRQLDDVMASLGVAHIDLLKMNIEGAELEVLEQSSAWLQRTRHVVVSCHDFKAQAPADDWMRTREPVRAVLERAGYVLHARPDDPRPWVRDYVYGARP